MNTPPIRNRDQLMTPKARTPLLKRSNSSFTSGGRNARTMPALKRSESRASISSICSKTSKASHFKSHTLKHNSFRYNRNRCDSPSNSSVASKASSIVGGGRSSRYLRNASEAPTVKVMLRIRPVLINNNNTDYNNSPIDRCINLLDPDGEEEEPVVIESGTGNDDDNNSKKKKIYSSLRVANDVKQTFTFDRIFLEKERQETVFIDAGKPIADSALEGYNASIFAYGQTGSGKTHTMQGPCFDSNDENRGLIPRVLEYCFLGIKKLKEQGNSAVAHCTYLEIYNDNVYDLLESPTEFQASQPNYQQKPKSIREDIQAGVFVEGAMEESIESAEEAVNLILRGAKSRHVAATNMNRESSRSHTIFTLTLQIKTPKDESKKLETIKTSKINLVDLAGSERQCATGAVGSRLNEAKHINKSLSALGNVISALVERSKGRNMQHIPHRDSKLTTLLRESLGGNTKTSIIATISAEPRNVMDTLSTLQFGQRAKNIKLLVKANTKLNADVPSLRREIKRLRNELEKLSNQKGMKEDIENEKNFVNQPASNINISSNEYLATSSDFLRLNKQSRNDDVNDDIPHEINSGDISSSTMLRQRILHLEKIMVATLKELAAERKSKENLKSTITACKTEIEILQDEIETLKIIKELLISADGSNNDLIALKKNIQETIATLGDLKNEGEVAKLNRINTELKTKLIAFGDQNSIIARQKFMEDMNEQLKVVLEDKYALEKIVEKLREQKEKFKQESESLRTTLTLKEDEIQDSMFGSQIDIAEALMLKEKELRCLRTYISKLEDEEFIKEETKVNHAEKFVDKKSNSRRHSTGVYSLRVEDATNTSNIKEISKSLLNQESSSCLRDPVYSSAHVRAVLMVAGEALKSAKALNLKHDEKASCLNSKSRALLSPVNKGESDSLSIEDDSGSFSQKYSLVNSVESAEKIVTEKLTRQLNESRRKLQKEKESNRRLSVQHEQAQRSARNEKRKLRQSLNHSTYDVNAVTLTNVGLELEVEKLRKNYEREVLNNKQLTDATNTIQATHKYEKEKQEKIISDLQAEIARLKSVNYKSVCGDSNGKNRNNVKGKNNISPSQNKNNVKAKDDISPSRIPLARRSSSFVLAENKNINKVDKTNAVKVESKNVASPISFSNISNKKNASVAEFFPTTESETSIIARNKMLEEDKKKMTNAVVNICENDIKKSAYSYLKRRSSISSINSSLSTFSSVKAPFRVLTRLTKTNHLKK